MAVEVTVLEGEDQVQDPDEHGELGVGQGEVHPLAPDVVTVKDTAHCCNNSTID